MIDQPTETDLLAKHDALLARFVLLRQVQNALRSEESVEPELEDDAEALVDAPADDDEDLDEKPIDLASGPAWDIEQLDNERATVRACDRMWSSYLLGSQEHGHEAAPVIPEFFREQLERIEASIAARAARKREADEARESGLEVEAPAEPEKGKVVMSEARSKVFDALKERGPLGLSAIAEVLGVEAPIAREILSFLREAGAIVLLGQRAQAKYALPGQSLPTKEEPPTEPAAPSAHLAPPTSAPLPPPPAPFIPPSADVPPSAIAALQAPPRNPTTLGEVWTGETRTPPKVLARAMRAERKRPTPRAPAPRAARPKLSFVEVVRELEGQGAAKQIPRKPGDPFLHKPQLKSGVFRFLGFAVEPKNPGAVKRLFDAAKEW